MAERTGGEPIGVVFESTGHRAMCLIDAKALTEARRRAGPAFRAATSVGGLVKISTAEVLLLGTITELAADRQGGDALIAEVEYIGAGPAGPDGDLAGFSRGLNLYPHPGDPVYLVTDRDEQRIFSPHGIPYIEIGTVHPSGSVRAPIAFDRLLGRHFAVVGSTGTGKSSLVALLLTRIIDVAPHSHVVVLDPHGEYARAFGPLAKIWSVDNLQLPYWFMNHEEHCEVFLASTGEDRTIDANIMAQILVKARQKNARPADRARITADSPVPYHLDDLIEALQEDMGRLEKPAEARNYIHLQLTIQQFFADRRFRFVFDPELWTCSLTKLLGDLLRFPAKGRPISIVDLAGVPSEIVDVVVSTLARLIFDFAVWAPREQRVPLLIVCEEAQRYLSREPAEGAISAQRQLDRIAREGRKYGVCLGLVTQRPSELSEAALSQCGTIIALRLNNVRDQAQLRAFVPESGRSYVDVIPALQNQECIVCGEGAPVPMRISIDDLPSHLTPASDDPKFSEKWNEAVLDDRVLAEAVRRWRES